ncbi:hypothetical protein [Aeromonas hydrophila]|uniref:hypothetical protein n=1 Tax=Aeromonas hydrophila TaxID=644 RepID=UPI003EC4C47A
MIQLVDEICVDPKRRCFYGSTIEIRECLSCFDDYFEQFRDAPPYYPHHDAANGIDCALYAILFDAAHLDATLTHE